MAENDDYQGCTCEWGGDCEAPVMPPKIRIVKVKNQPPDLTAGEFNRGE